MKTETLDNSTFATHPGGVSLSREKLKLLHPEVLSPLRWFVNLKLNGDLFPVKDRAFWLKYIEEHLTYGDSGAAVVISTFPLLVAAYSIELDCVAVLKFDDIFTTLYGLREGSRLVAVNTYYDNPEQCEPDLTLGPFHLGRYGNFAPYIAEFLTDDLARLGERKDEIDEEEWHRTWELGKRYLEGGAPPPRDGRPFLCLFSGSSAQRY